MFLKYPHLERFGTDEVESIELGECYVFPKIDGTNASVWVDESGVIKTGSRNRELSIDNDNAGFALSIRENESITDLLSEHPHLRLYGEWLVPHSLKTYREDAWRKFYVFDVYCHSKDRFMHFEEYNEVLFGSDIEYIRPISIIKNPSYEQLLDCMKKNTFLIDEGKGSGEGIVVKNYSYENRYGRKTWAKMVTNEFKDKHVKAMGPSILDGAKMVEEDIVDQFVTTHLVDKTYDKIRIEREGFNSRCIPELLGRVFHDLVSEEIWNFVKANKSPTINFKTLNTLTIRKIKELKPELF